MNKSKVIPPTKNSRSAKINIPAEVFKDMNKNGINGGDSLTWRVKGKKLIGTKEEENENDNEVKIIKQGI